MDIFEGIKEHTFVQTMWGIMDFMGGLFRRSVPLLEGLVVLDGLINGALFAKEYMLYKISENKVNKDDRSGMREAMLRNCRGLYEVGVLDRYMMYTILHMMYTTQMLILGVMYSIHGTKTNVESIVYMGYCVLAFPRVQRIIRERFEDKVRVYEEGKEIFVKYALSKAIMRGLHALDDGVEGVKNYHLFLIYSAISWESMYECMRSYGIVVMLHFLRGCTGTYYYYKAVKLAYFYNSGVLFSIMNRDDAVHVINKVIKEKRWQDFSKVEALNALYTLVYKERWWNEDMGRVRVMCFKVFGIWSLVCVIKLLKTMISGTLCIGYLTLLWYKRRGIKEGLIVIIVYGMMMMNANDLIITMVYIGRRLMYKMYEELIFYGKHYKDIRKMVRHVKRM